MRRVKLGAAHAVFIVTAVLAVAACGSSSSSSSNAAASSSNTSSGSATAATVASTSGGCPAVTPSELVQSGTLTVSVSGTAPPLDYVNSAGHPAGMYIDLVRLWAKDLGIKNVNFVEGPFESMLAGLTTGRWDIGGAGVSQTPARLASHDFVLSKPYLLDGVSLMVKANSSIQSFADMHGKALGGAAGEAEFIAAQAAAHASRNLAFPGALEARQALKNGLVDAVAGDVQELQYYVKTAPGGGGFRVLTDIIDSEPSGTAFRTQDHTLIAGVNCEIEKELNDGTMASLATKYFGTPVYVTQLQTYLKQKGA